MLKQTISYVDNNGTTRTEDFWFNLTVAEVTELEFQMPGGGMTQYLTSILEKKDAGEMLRAFKTIVTTAYGERSADGRFFLKETESGYSLGRRFAQSPAYSALFMDMLGVQADDNAFSEFIRGCVPAEMLEGLPEDLNVKPEEATPVFQQQSTVVPPQNEVEKKLEQYSREELLEMPQDQFDELAGTDPQQWTKPVMLVAFQRRGNEKSAPATTEA